MRPPLPLILLCTLAALVVVPVLAGMDQVVGHFTAGRYADARAALAGSAEEGRPAEAILWRSRLESDPDKADALLVSGLEETTLPAATRAGLALQLAHLRFARNDHQGAYDILQPFLSAETVDLPGEGLIIAALCQRAIGNLQRAREFLAAIKPEDPAFTSARYFLGPGGDRPGPAPGGR
ncbi:hypothetical protein CSA17_05545 [bacterium DOLJORAL78_65_58]|nr:MAG: hypothetical protein CSA17_05545 [bacterium DOLJORAL78_65_58]